jgi:hypothetical protein
MIIVIFTYVLWVVPFLIQRRLAHSGSLVQEMHEGSEDPAAAEMGVFLMNAGFLVVFSLINIVHNNMI